MKRKKGVKCPEIKYIGPFRLPCIYMDDVALRKISLKIIMIIVVMITNIIIISAAPELTVVEIMTQVTKQGT